MRARIEIARARWRSSAPNRCGCRPCGLVLELCAECGFDRVPVSVERGDASRHAAAAANLGLPRRSLRAFPNEDRVVLQFGEEAAPLRIDRVGVACVMFVKLFDISGVAAVQKGRESKGVGCSSSALTLRRRSRSAHCCLVLPFHSPSLRSHKSLLGRRRLPIRTEACNYRPSIRPPESCRAGPARGRPRSPPLPWRRFFPSAPPLPPEMIAPACPIRRPFGAVRPAMKPTIGFCGRVWLIAQKLRRVFFRAAADLADHDDRLRLIVGKEQLEHVDKFRSLHRIAADADRGRLAETLAARLEHRLIGQVCRSAKQCRRCRAERYWPA